MGSQGRSGRAVLALVTAVLSLGLAGCGGDSEPAGSSDGEVTSDAFTAPASPSVPVAPSATPTPTEPPPARPSAPRRTPPSTPTPTSVAPREPVLGADLSWPQCPLGMGIPQKRSKGAPLPIEAARFVIVGLTNGPGFYPNPCLSQQVDLVRDRGLWGAAYAVASYPSPDLVAAYAAAGPFDGSSRLGALANTGYQQARFNVTSMLRTGFETPMVWIDVEPVPDFEWSADLEANAAVVRGVARGYRDANYRIGVYSTPFLWDEVVGGLELGVPEWRAAGQTSRAEATARCGPAWVIQGGVSVIAQWVQDGRDMNVTCPGTADDMERWFHRY